MSRFAEPGSRILPGRGDRVVVAGTGRSGAAAARALVRLGASVIVADDKADDATRARAESLGAERIVLGRLDPALAQDADLIVASPGIRPDVPLLSAAAEAKVPVWSEVELGWRLASVPVLGVTGTNGKTTATEMLAAAITAGGIRCIAAGNIGTPLTEAAASDAEAIVAELSSFQLHSIVSFHSPVAVLLNLAEDHLDWHGSPDAYASAKGRLFERQSASDTAVVLDDDRCLSAAGTAGRIVRFSPTGVPRGGAGAGVSGGMIVVPEGSVVAMDRLQIHGRAMLADAVAAAAAACAFGAPPDRVGDALAAFRAAPHRMELIATIAGVAYVNDSKATNPHAALAALSGLERVVLIAGGRNKGLDLSPLASAAGVVAVVAIGESASSIVEAFEARGVHVQTASTMRAAVAAARDRAEPGDTILLSPACASFDMFNGYEDRGGAFRAAVEDLANEGGVT